MKSDNSFKNEALRRSLFLYAVTDRRWLDGRSLSSCVQDAIEGGASFVQLREKNLDQENFFSEAKELRALCRAKGVPFVVNDNLEIAKKVCADGVHVGQTDASCLEARRLLGPDKIVGVSASTVGQAILAEKQGADYLGVGAVFATGSKNDADNVSFEVLKEICASVKIPVVAIGGIGAHNVLRLKDSGIAGISVISAIFANDDIKAATKHLALLDKMALGPKAAIFDLDGTLLDSLAAWEGLAAKIVQSFGGKKLLKEEAAALDKKVFSMSMEDCGKYLIKTYNLNCDCEAAVQEANKILLGEYENSVALLPGALETLKALKEGGVPICGATSGSRVLEEAALKRLGIFDFFEKIFYCSELKTSKKEALIYKSAADFMGLEPSQALVVEDSREAFEAAKSAGFETFLV